MIISDKINKITESLKIVSLTKDFAIKDFSISSVINGNRNKGDNNNTIIPFSLRFAILNNTDSIIKKDNEVGARNGLLINLRPCARTSYCL
jgi:hypothetical protein